MDNTEATPGTYVTKEVYLPKDEYGVGLYTIKGVISGSRLHKDVVIVEWEDFENADHTLITYELPKNINPADNTLKYPHQRG